MNPPRHCSTCGPQARPSGEARFICTTDSSCRNRDPAGIPFRALDAESILRPLVTHLSNGATESDVLFPRLVHVVYHPSWTHELYSRLLLNPQLRELRLPTVAFTDVSDWSFGPNISHHSYPVMTKHIGRLAYHIVPAVRRMHDFRAVWTKATLWDSDTLDYLGSLPNLTAFALESGWGAIMYPPRAELKQRAFPAVTQLLCPLPPGKRRSS
ncbi:hypothetical protein BV20DRAFT_72560 [Pilatotrama ljubarskyi]|nr:hypothetical protein BV20DRAFT_72560 [Pilatotrama ljubarskyi]